MRMRPEQICPLVRALFLPRAVQRGCRKAPGSWRRVMRSVFMGHSMRVRGCGRTVPQWRCGPDRPRLSGRQPAARETRARLACGAAERRSALRRRPVASRPAGHGRSTVTTPMGDARTKTASRYHRQLDSARKSLMRRAPRVTHAGCAGTVRAQARAVGQPRSRPGACGDPLPFNGPVPSVPEAPGLRRGDAPGNAQNANHFRRPGPP